MIVLILFAYLLYRLFLFAENAPDFFAGPGSWDHDTYCPSGDIEYLCVVLNWIPTAGITLPFHQLWVRQSLFLMLEIAIALSISRQIKFTE